MSVETAKPVGLNGGNSGARRFIKRPDDSVMKSEVNKLRKEIEKLDSSINELNNQINKISIDSTTNSKKNELQKELKELTSQQATIKNERTTIMDQIKVVDNQLKRKLTEIQAQTSKNSFKSVRDIDNKIDQLDNLVSGGSLSLAEERKTVKEMTALRKLKKDFGSIEKQQESIDQDKSKINDLKKKLNSIQNKEVQAKYETIQKELDTIRNANKSIYDKKGALVTKRNNLRKEKDAKYDSIKSLKSEFNEEFAKFKKQLNEEKKKREEELKAQQEEEKKLKKKLVAEKQLKEASKPAFEDEINSIHSLLTYFDPSYVRPQPKKLGNESFITNSSSIRTVEMPADVVILKKEEKSYLEGTNAKKNKNASRKSKSKFVVAPDIITALGDLSIPLPTKQEDVEETVKSLKETLSALESKQDEQTKINIEKAKAKIATLEADADAEQPDAETVEATESETKEEN